MWANMPNVNLLAQQSRKSEPFDHFTIALHEFDYECNMNTMNNKRKKKYFLPHD
jgi:hypothetical protein